MEVGGHLHAPAALLPGKDPPQVLKRYEAGEAPHPPTDTVGKRKMNSDFSAIQSIACCYTELQGPK
jgi:hypothetical protein